jgi:hypothetical protein
MMMHNKVHESILPKSPGVNEQVIRDGGAGDAQSVKRISSP